MKQCLWKWTTPKGASILHHKCLLDVPVASETPSSPHLSNVGYNHKHLIPTMVGEHIIQPSSDREYPGPYNPDARAVPYLLSYAKHFFM